MKSKLWLICVLVVSMFVGACSCDKFDINTYTSAVRNYDHSTGLDYKLTVVTQTEGENFFTTDTIENKYELSTTRVVLNYSSELSRRKTEISEFGPNPAPYKIFEHKRYYVGETRKFYTYTFLNTEVRNIIENTTYEEANSGLDEYNILNIVPTFDKENISSFNIIDDETRNGYSIATFTSVCPSTLSCDSEQITYKVTIDRSFYFSSIEFTTVFEGTTTSYKYEFNKYNSDVDIVFPDDLNNY